MYNQQIYILLKDFNKYSSENSNWMNKWKHLTALGKSIKNFKA